jgi:hypothetical protein
MWYKFTDIWEACIAFIISKLLAYFAYSLTVTTEAVHSSETTQTTWTRILEDGIFIVTAVRTSILTYKFKPRYMLHVIFNIA